MEMPDVLNRLAAAGPAGLELGGDSSLLKDLDLCRAWGFPIEFVGGRACMVRGPDPLVPAWIEQEAAHLAWKKIRVAGFLEIGSTNDYALACSRAGAPEGTVIVAERQTAGKGRMGRKWISPARAGLYFSLVVRPRLPFDVWPLLTHAASVSLFRSLQDLKLQRQVPGDLALDLKWPNDVLLSGKKTAGILLETVFCGDTAEAAVIGVGVNIAPGSVPADLADKATAIGCETGVRVPRRWLLVRFLAHFHVGYRLFSAGLADEIIAQWKGCSSMWDGAEINVHDGHRVRAAVTCGLTRSGALRIRTADGSEETLLAGDVTVRRR